jgi:hypothetical protein
MSDCCSLGRLGPLHSTRLSVADPQAEAAIADRWGIRSFGHMDRIFTVPITIATTWAPRGGALLAGLTHSLLDAGRAYLHRQAGRGQSSIRS